MSVLLTERAPAKVNLALHVLGRYPSGLHEIESLVAFAGCGDTLTLEPGKGLALDVDGPSAAGAGPHADNLVLRAARNLMSVAPNLLFGHFRLTKRLPAAAGLGGGSSDAAAALRLLARANGLSLADERLFAAAVKTGADVPVCLEARARVMSGVGESLGPLVAALGLFAVLVNPGVALETKAVFEAMGYAPGERGARTAGFVFHSGSAPELIARLRGASNDMESAACALAPAVTDALAALRSAPEARLTRMSGSGATCFALFESCRDASRVAKRLRANQRSWWIKATVLR